MCIEKQIDDLIEAGWKVIATDFDPVAFLTLANKGRRVP